MNYLEELKATIINRLSTLENKKKEYLDDFSVFC